MFKDNRGQIFSLDAFLAVIIITVIIGISANAMDIAGFKIADYSSSASLDRITTDAANILINTPGSPANWEYSADLDQVTPGLAEYGNDSRNGTKILSIKKIDQLSSNYLNLVEGKVIPFRYNSSVIIYPIDPALKPIVVHNETLPANASEVAVVNRTVLIDFMSLNVLASINPYFNSLIGAEKLVWCPHHNLRGVKDHNKPNSNLNAPGWTCRPFKVSQWDLNFTDFYLISDPSALNDESAIWILDRPENQSEIGKKFDSKPIKMNDRISELLGQDNSTVMWLHVFTSGDSSKAFNAYLVGVPKNTPPENVSIEYLNPQPGYLVLTVWM